MTSSIAFTPASKGASHPSPFRSRSIIYQRTIQVGALNDIAVDSGGCDRSTKTKLPDRSDRMCTFVVNNGKVDRQQVSIGQRSDLAVEIRQGIKQGDIAILHPTEQLRSGDRVCLR